MSFRSLHNSYNLHNLYNLHNSHGKFTFLNAYEKKTVKHFLIHFLLYIKMTKINVIKDTKNSFVLIFNYKLVNI